MDEQYFPPAWGPEGPPSAPPAPAPAPASFVPTPADAQARIEALKADKAFFQRLVARDPGARQEWDDLHSQAFGAHAQSVDGIMRQMNAREQKFAAEDEARWRDRVNPEGPQEMFEYERGNATTSEKAAARRNIARMIADKQFGAKIIGGDYEALQYWNRMQWVAYRATEVPDA